MRTLFITATAIAGVTIAASTSYASDQSQIDGGTLAKGPQPGTIYLAQSTVKKKIEPNSAKKTVRRIKARNQRELERGLSLSAGNPNSQLQITCHPPSNSWCAKDFQTACEKGGGGLSTEPDGGITCTSDHGD